MVTKSPPALRTASSSAVAQRMGCVNTIVRRPDGSLYGDNTDAAGFITYLNILEDNGWKQYSNNIIEGVNLFATYTKGDSVVHVSYLTDSFMEADYASLTANEKAYYDRSFRPIGKEVRIAAPKSVYVVKSGRNVFKIF